MSEIAAVLQHYIDAAGHTRPLPLARRFGWQQMWCPFHDDRSPSASIHFDKGRFHCFVCGIKGDAIDVVRWKEGVDFAGAVEFLAGIPGAGDRQVRGGTPEGRTVFGRARVLPGQRTIFSSRRGRGAGAGT